MKITNESAGNLELKDVEYNKLFIGPIFAALGILIFIVSSGSWQNGGSYVGPIFGGIFLIFGVGITISFKRSTITIDKTANNVKFLRIGLFGSNIKDYTLDQIESLALKERWVINQVPNANNRGMSRPTLQDRYQLIFRMKDGTEISLDHLHSSSSKVLNMLRSPTRNERELGQKISSFMGIPFQDTGTAPGNVLGGLA